MPRSADQRSSTLRRFRKADLLLRRGRFAMRACSYCSSRDLLCVVFETSEHCAECYRTHRRCELASPMAKVKRLASKAEKLRKQRIKAEMKAIRLRKQERALYKKMRELGDRED
jgi:hypothetical protein